MLFICSKFILFLYFHLFIEHFHAKIQVVSCTKGGLIVATHKKSKRQRRTRIIIYIMIIAMLLSSLTAGLAMFI